ncbi:hypothetical protein B0H13DRAFT_1896034 [Mycena leptocephala]|nr:hypothetical protein B0H13DRAFT_1896034 [Mycena leptocephala]
MSAYTISDAAESLLDLSLDRETLLSDFYIPPEGYPRFWQYRLRALVHGIMWAATHDFQFLGFLPSYPLTKHRQLCSWVEVLLWHLVGRTPSDSVEASCCKDHRASPLEPRSQQDSLGDCRRDCPGEAFHMLQLVSFLCHFVGYTNGDDSVESLCPTILLPLIGCRGEYPEYDRNGRLQYTELLRSPCPPPFLFGGQVPMSNPSLQVLTAPMGVTDFLRGSSEGDQVPMGRVAAVADGSPIFRYQLISSTELRFLRRRLQYSRKILACTCVLESECRGQPPCILRVRMPPYSQYSMAHFRLVSAPENRDVHLVNDSFRSLKKVTASYDPFPPFPLLPFPIVANPTCPAPARDCASSCNLPLLVPPISALLYPASLSLLLIPLHTMAPGSSSRPKPTPKSILKKYHREVTPFAPNVEVVVVPDSSEEVEEEGEDEDEEMGGEDDELDTPSSPSVPVTPKKPRAASSAPPSPASSAVAIPRSFRERLSSSRLVPAPRRPDEHTVEQPEADKAGLERTLDTLSLRLQPLEDPTWQLVPVNPVPPFDRPTAAPPINYSGEPVVPDSIVVEIPPELPPSAPIADQRARLVEISQKQKEADRRRRERIVAMEALEEFCTRCKLEQPIAFWRSVDAAQRVHDARVTAYEEKVHTRADEPRQIRAHYDRYAAEYEGVKADLAELVSWVDQIQCGIRALASLLDEACHIHNLIRAVRHEGSLGEYLDLVMDVLHLDSPTHGMVYETIPLAPRPRIRVLPPHPVASSSKKRARKVDKVPDSAPNKTFNEESFDQYLKDHVGIASTLEKKVGREPIVYAGGCKRCARMGPCFTTLSASSSKKGALGSMCLPCVVAKKCCRHGKFYVYPETGEACGGERRTRGGSQGQGKARETVTELAVTPAAAAPLLMPSAPDILPNASHGSVTWEPALTYGLDALTPLPGDRLDRIPSSSRRGHTMKFGFPPEECSDEECARRYTARIAATMQYFTYMHRSNAQLAGHEFILCLVENLHLLRYRLPLSVGPTPSLHSDAYPVPIPELRGNVQWRALLHAYADEMPILMHHTRSELVEDDLDRLHRGEFCEPGFSGLEGFRAVDAYRWITWDSISSEVLSRLEDKSLFLPSDEPATPASTPPPLDFPSLTSAIESSHPLVDDAHARMNLAPDTDTDMAPPVAPPVLSFGKPPLLLSSQPATGPSAPAPLSPVADRGASEVRESAHRSSVARSEAGDIIVSSGGREESLSRALDSGLRELGGGSRSGSVLRDAAEDVSMDVDEGGRSDAETLRLGAIDSREASFDALEEGQVESRRRSVGAGTASA